MAAAKWTEVAPSARQCSSRVPGPRDGGICFGAQIMSASLGGTASPSLRPEYGWGHIESDEPAISLDPRSNTTGTSSPSLRVLHAWHTTTPVSRPSALGAVWGVQFHPEVTPPLLESWCAMGGDMKLIDAGIDPEELIEERRLVWAPVSQPALEHLLDWWLDDPRHR